CVPEGRAITQEASCVRIGALITHAALAASPFAREHRAFADCGSGIADAQVRNLGTLGGSLAEADPSSCWPVLMVALDARVRCLGPDGERLQPVRSLLKDAYTPDLAAAEVITEIEIPRIALQGDGVFVAFKRAAPAYPSASCALQVVIEGDEVRSVRLALGCVALKALPVDGAAGLLQGRPLTTERIDALAELAAGASEPVADNKGSEAYKRSLIRGLVRRAFAIVQARRAGHAHEPTHAYYG
ncbi:MAG: carbon monoxide dehydrogenase, partial [Alphaproteobacteria bacterium]|nr:carbon monoxide dehydrogenase [Alphaproteobacteria bacterium]